MSEKQTTTKISWAFVAGRLWGTMSNIREMMEAHDFSEAYTEVVLCLDEMDRITEDLSLLYKANDDD